jgi:hypothetical protein
MALFTSLDPKLKTTIVLAVVLVALLAGTAVTVSLFAVFLKLANFVWLHPGQPAPMRDSWKPGPLQSVRHSANPHSYTSTIPVFLAHFPSEYMKSSNLFALAMSVALLAAAGSASAAGCLKGAVVGGVAGHYAGHHAVVGAIGGCVVGHHLAKKNAENQAQALKAQQRQAAMNG